MVMPSESTQFKKGNTANPSGRPKGAKTKIRFDVAQTLKDLNYCPFTHLHKIANDDGWPKRERTQAACELAGYVAPKLKAVELSASDIKEGFQFMFNIKKEENVGNKLQRDEDSEPVSS